MLRSHTCHSETSTSGRLVSVVTASQIFTSKFQCQTSMTSSSSGGSLEEQKSLKKCGRLQSFPNKLSIPCTSLSLSQFHSFLDCTSNKPTVGAYKYTQAGCSKPSTCAVLAEKCQADQVNQSFFCTIHQKYRILLLLLIDPNRILWFAIQFTRSDSVLSSLL